MKYESPVTANSVSERSCPTLHIMKVNKPSYTAYYYLASPRLHAPYPSLHPFPPLRAAPALVCSKDLRRARKIEHLSSRSLPPSLPPFLPCCCLLSFGPSFLLPSFFVMTSGEREGGIDETVGLLSCPETQSNEYLTTSRAFLKVKAEMHWRERERERQRDIYSTENTLQCSICAAPSVLCSAAW